MFSLPVLRIQTQLVKLLDGVVPSLSLPALFPNAMERLLRTETSFPFHHLISFPFDR